MSNPSGIMGFLNNTQQVLKTAQSFGPIIQQYGPLVKNIPAMWKLYRGLKNAPDSSEEKTDEKDEKKEEIKEESSSSIELNDSRTNTKRKTTRKISNKKSHRKSIPRTENQKRKGSSVPKLYI
jgi:hypothetical protein